VIGRVCVREPEERSEAIFLGPTSGRGGEDFLGYRGILSGSVPADVSSFAAVPLIHSLREIDHFSEGDIVVLQPNGFVRTLYRPASQHNALFLTERCNSNCLMCSQPPKDHDDTGFFTALNLELIRLMRPAPSYLGITGGEPTLLGDGLFRILAALRDMLPDTHVHMLTNGRAFAWTDATRALAAVAHPRLTLGIPLYSDSAVLHDYIVQAHHAFDQTILGLYNLARWGIQVEIRVVLHRLTTPRLPELATYICRNLPFAVHVALMGLEPTGYTPRNRDTLWIDPANYQRELERAVEILTLSGMNVSIYNSQLCVLTPALWRFARRSISDWKNIYLSECTACSKIEQCGGLFQSATQMHSQYLRAL